MNWFRNILKRIPPLRRLVLWMRNGKSYVKSYSQIGEDTIVHYLFKRLGIQHPTYIDVGANDPFWFNNTALLYGEGSTGLNIEPDSDIFRDLASVRTRDINLNIGISNTVGEAELYLCNDDKRNTFSKEESERLAKEFPSLSFTATKVPVTTISAVIEKYCGEVFPDFLSLDAEGFDQMILESIEYEKSAPKVICVETIRSGDAVERFLLTKGYFKFSGTYLNSIFCKKDIWDNR